MHLKNLVKIDARPVQWLANSAETEALPS